METVLAFGLSNPAVSVCRMSCIHTRTPGLQMSQVFPYVKFVAFWWFPTTWIVVWARCRYLLIDLEANTKCIADMDLHVEKDEPGLIDVSCCYNWLDCIDALTTQPEGVRRRQVQAIQLARWSFCHLDARDMGWVCMFATSVVVAKIRSGDTRYLSSDGFSARTKAEPETLLFIPSSASE